MKTILEIAMLLIPVVMIIHNEFQITCINRAVAEIKKEIM